MSDYRHAFVVLMHRERLPVHNHGIQCGLAVLVGAAAVANGSAALFALACAAAIDQRIDGRFVRAIHGIPC